MKTNNKIVLTWLLTVIMTLTLMGSTGNFSVVTAREEAPFIASDHARQLQDVPMQENPNALLEEDTVENTDPSVANESKSDQGEGNPTPILDPSQTPEPIRESKVMSTAPLFETLKEQVANAADGDVITLIPGEYLFTESLIIADKNITFKSNGGVVFKKDPSFNRTMIRIENTGGLTLESTENGLIFDGEMQTARDATSFILTKGSFIIDGATFKNDKGGSGLHRSPITADGPGATIELNAGIVENNDYTKCPYSSGAFFLENGARMVMNGGTIRNNIGSSYHPYHDDFVWSDSPGAGAVFVYSGADFVMNGGDIHNNEGYGGAILIGEPSPYAYNRRQTDPSKLAEQALATATFYGGTIRNNHGVRGGAISGHGHVDIQIPADSTLLIDSNRAYQGGGIFVSDWYVDGVWSDNKTGSVSIEDWNQKYLGGFVMEGGTVVNNKADRSGGGINISTNNAKLLAGKIQNNVAGSQGGGIYVTAVPYVLHIENAYIVDNHAQLIERKENLTDGSGGGVWFCPTGDAIFYAESGAVLAENDALNTGDDFFNELKSIDYATVTLPTRSPTGEKITYYEDFKGHRYKDGHRTIVEDVNNIKEELALKAILSGDDLQPSRELSTLFIEGNTASKGGGIGSNGNIIFGHKPQEHNPLKNLKINKIWEEGTFPKEISVDVRIKEIAGVSSDYLLETVILNEGNSYTETLYDLPATIGGIPIEDLIYVKEVDSDQWESQVSEIKKIGQDGANILFEIDVTNAMVKIDIPVTKTWEGTKTEEVTIHLLADGKIVATAVLDDSHHWQHLFEDMPLINAETGEPIVYTVQEEAIEGYTATVTGEEKTGFTVHNKENPPETPEQPEPPKPRSDKPEPPHKSIFSGDTTNILLWSILGALSMAGIGLLFYQRKMNQ